MDYQEFRDLWHKALKAAHLQIPYPIGPTEKINLRNMSQSYELILYGGSNLACKPFHITTMIEWNWDATLSARYATTEEDMLMQIFGDFSIHDDDTDFPRLRMDVNLYSGVILGTEFPMPMLSQWQNWVKQISDNLQSLLPTDYDEDGWMCASSEPLHASIKLLENGCFGLENVTFKAFQIITLPRQWDDPEKSDPYPDVVLLDFANRIAKAMYAMENNMMYLVEGRV